MKTKKVLIAHYITAEHITAACFDLLIAMEGNSEIKMSKQAIDWHVRKCLRKEGEDWITFHGAFEEYPEELQKKALEAGKNFFPELCNG